MVKKPDMSVKIGSLSLKNPIMSASGTFGYGTEFERFFNPERLGAIVLKGLSVERVEGNPAPRIYETPSGMINAIGLQNVGVDNFLKDKLPKLQELDVPAVANIWGRDEREYIEIAERLNDIDAIDAFELNISCPNVKKGGLEFGSNPNVAADLVSKVRAVTTKPLWVKLAPSAPDIGGMSQAVEDAGADAVTLVNSIPAMAVDVRSRKPRIANVIGGLSGPAIHPIAVRMVYQAARAVTIPVIGIGGVNSAADALEFLIVGARGVQIGTAGFINPHIFTEVIDGIEEFLIEEGTGKIEDIIGSLEL